MQKSSFPIMNMPEWRYGRNASAPVNALSPLNASEESRQQLFLSVCLCDLNKKVRKLIRFTFTK